MSLGEPQYPRKLMWWEYAEAKTTFLVRLGLIICVVVCVALIWSAKK